MKTTIVKLISAGAGMAMLVSSAALPTFAQTTAVIGVNANASASATVGGSGTPTTIGVGAHGGADMTVRTNIVAKLISTAQTHADQEIARRIDNLNKLSARINAMVKISASDKSSLSATIQAQITAMNNLQTQIAADVAANSTSSLKTDIQSITKSYRIFALVIPQGALEAAADRALTIAGMFSTLAGQLQTRITAAQNAGVAMSTSVSALADMNTKVADAQTQANAAVAEITSLQPDNGDATVKASNTAALKDAHSKIQAAQQDLVTTRKDAGTIVKALLAVKVSASGSSTVSTTGTTTEQ